MIASNPYLSPDTHQQPSLQPQLSPRSARNKIQRKPENFKPRNLEAGERKHKDRNSDFAGFYSPKHQPDPHSPSTIYQIAPVPQPHVGALRNHRSMTSLNKMEHSRSKMDIAEAINKENSMSSSSMKSLNQRKMGRLNLEMKALTIENDRLRGQNRTLREENNILKAELSGIADGLPNRTTSSFSKTSILGLGSHTLVKAGTDKPDKSPLVISTLSAEIEALKQKLKATNTCLEANQRFQITIKDLESVNQQQREELFSRDKLIKYLEIELRTLKKQKVSNESYKRLQTQLCNMDVQNRHLRRIVVDLQSRLKDTMLFQLTPDVSQKSESFLLD